MPYFWAIKDNALQQIDFTNWVRWDILNTSRHLQEVKEAIIAIEFPEMKKVHLEELPSLRSFSSGDIIKLPSLENVVVNHCPNIKKFGLGKITNSNLKLVENEAQIDLHTKMTYPFELSDDEFSVITEYNINDEEELVKIIHNHHPSHFTNLQVFRAKNCNQMLTEFLFILAKKSHKLEVIDIEECKTLYYYLFDNSDFYKERGGDGKYFTQLKRLKLTRIYEMERIWNDDNPGILYLENLQILHLKSCPFLRYIFGEYPMEKLHQLKELMIEECEALTHVFLSRWRDDPRTKLPLLSKMEFKSLPKLIEFYCNYVEFPSLKYLKIEKCPILRTSNATSTDSREMLTTNENSFFELNEIIFDSYDKLVCVITSETLEELRNLKKVFVSHCQNLTIIFNTYKEIYSSTYLLQQLHELILIDLPKLTHIVNNNIFMFYPNLKVLQVKKCKTLRKLPMPVSVVNMEISNCEALEEIMIIKEQEEEEKEEETREKLIFSELKDVSLENLINISIVFPFGSEFPSLETLKITNCSTMRTFVEDSKDFTDASTTNYFFPNSLLLDKLKKLHIISMDVEKLWNYNYPSESFCELEYLNLTNNNKLLSVMSSSMIMRFEKLKKLTLKKCDSLIEVFNLEDDKLDPKIHEIFHQLGVLALINLIKLKNVWSKEPQVTYFKNLVSLYVLHCGSLKSLFSFSSVKNLGKLKILKLCNCDKIEEIISSDIKEDENEPIIFPELECLVLKDLPELVSFYGQSKASSWPMLKTVRMSNIPNMKIFSRSILNMPLLRSIDVTFVKKLWFESLNNTLSYIHNNSEFIAMHIKPRKKGQW